MSRTIEDLRQKQGLPLSTKILLTQARLRQWVNEYGMDGVYISFSGGKDSTVLCDIFDRMYPDNDVPKLFVNTGLEYPEVVQFVKTKKNVVIVRPEMNFKSVIQNYGYPFPSKEAAECIEGAQIYLRELLQGDEQAHYSDFYDKLCGTGKYAKSVVEEKPLETSEEFARLLQERKDARSGGSNLRLALMMGMATRDNRILPADKIPQKDKSAYAQKKWRFFLDDGAPSVSSKCCKIMKKNPAHKFSHKTKRKPITAEMADESRLRTQKWLQNGCNGFDLKEPKSTPMAFWTEQDVLQYIKQYGIEIASVYGDVVSDTSDDLVAHGQMHISDFLGGSCKLKTTGCSRTGCMFCGFGCHLERQGEGRFVRLKQTHPKIYEWIMKPTDQGGLGYKEVIDWINEHGDLRIEY